MLFTWLHFIIGDIEIAHDRATELERDCREHGALGTLPQVQLLQAHCLVFLGRFREAKAAAAEALKLAADTGEAQSTVELSVVLAEIAAIEGDEERCRELVARAIDQDVAPSSIFAATALSLLDLGVGHRCGHAPWAEVSCTILRFDGQVQEHFDRVLPGPPGNLRWAPWYIAYVLLFNMLVGPVFSAGSVTSERERQTLDLLLVTDLTPKEFDLLVYFARQPGKVLTHRALLAAIWGGDFTEQTEYLRVFIGQLRKKLELNASSPRYLLTEPWVGYRFEPGG